MFNKNLKNIRLKQGLSQKQVADYLNVSPQSVSKWEKGEALPSIEFLPKMAECLNCDINSFFVPSEEAPLDLEMLKEFFEVMTEHLYEETKTTEDVIPFLKKCPNIVEVLKNLVGKIKEYQIVKPKTIQGILGCSEEETPLFVGYFIRNEFLEKIDGEDSYFVVKHTLDGIVTLVSFMMYTREEIENLITKKNT